MSVPFEENAVLEALINIRTRLTAIKKDPHLVRAKDVLKIRSDLLDQVVKLNEIRAATAARQEAEAQEQASSGGAGGDGADSGATLRAASTSSPVTARTEPLNDPTQQRMSPAPPPISASTSSAVPGENRVDMILGDVFHLLSLFFLRIGKSRESPAAFCQLASMIRLLKHMNESAVYTEQDLVPYADRLAELREIIENDSSSRGREEGPSARENALTMLLMKKFQVCDKLLHKLRAALERVSPELADLHARLIHLRRYLASVASRPHPHTHDISHALRELREIEEGRLSDGRFLAASVRAAKADKAAARAKQLRETKEAKRKARQDKKREAGDIAGAEENESDSSDDDEEEADDDEVASDDDDEQALMDEPGAVPEEGQELIAGLLETNFEICQDIQARESEHEVASGPLEPIYHRLCELRSQLERLALTHRWTLRETDLYNYMMVLSDIDSMRKDGGKFRDSEGNVPKNQLILLYLLRRCYGLVYRLMASSDPISEELIPYANKLSTIKRCLVEVRKFGGPYSARDLYPYQLAIRELDDLRTPEGVFPGHDGSIPEGQAILNALLSEVHEMLAEMREEGVE